MIKFMPKTYTHLSGIWSLTTILVFVHGFLVVVVIGIVPIPMVVVVVVEMIQSVGFLESY